MYGRDLDALRCDAIKKFFSMFPRKTNCIAANLTDEIETQILWHLQASELGLEVVELQFFILLCCWLARRERKKTETHPHSARLHAKVVRSWKLYTKVEKFVWWNNLMHMHKVAFSLKAKHTWSKLFLRFYFLLFRLDFGDIFFAISWNGFSWSEHAFGVDFMAIWARSVGW